MSVHVLACARVSVCVSVRLYVHITCVCAPMHVCMHVVVEMLAGWESATTEQEEGKKKKKKKEEEEGEVRMEMNEEKRRRRHRGGH